MFFINKLLYNPFGKNIFFWIFSSCIAIIEFINTIGFISISFSPYFIPLLISIPVIISFFNTHTKFSFLYLIFFIYLVLNVYITDPPVYFFSKLRLGLFIILLLGVSPIIENHIIRYFRFNLYQIFFYFCIPVSVISFFCYFLGINFVHTAYEFNDLLNGKFGGLFKHSMILGPLSACSTIILVWMALNKNKSAWILAFLTFGAVLFSASRAALISVIGALISFGLTTSNKIFGSIKTIFIISLLTFASYPLWETILEPIQSKSERDYNGATFDSRQDKVEARVQEIKEEPILGQGFSAIDPTLDNFGDFENGRVEPGSSWLAVFSMTGIIGLLFFVLICIKAIKDILRARSVYKSLFIALLVFFLIHLIVEGYVYAAGSPLCFLFWLTIGICTDLSYLTNSRNNKIL